MEGPKHDESRESRNPFEIPVYLRTIVMVVFRCVGTSRMLISVLSFQMYFHRIIYCLVSSAYFIPLTLTRNIESLLTTYNPHCDGVVPVDLSYTFDKNTIYWGDGDSFFLNTTILREPDGTP